MSLKSLGSPQHNLADFRLHARPYKDILLGVRSSAIGIKQVTSSKISFTKSRAILRAAFQKILYLSTRRKNTLHLLTYWNDFFHFRDHIFLITHQDNSFGDSVIYIQIIFQEVLTIII